MLSSKNAAALQGRAPCLHHYEEVHSSPGKVGKAACDSGALHRNLLRWRCCLDRPQAMQGTQVT
jgi:hypothetical protein